jgi:hypothetical protein
MFMTVLKNIMILILYIVGGFLVYGGVFAGGGVSGFLGGIAILAFAWVLTPHEFSGAHRRHNRAHATQLDDYRIQVDNLDDVDMKEFSKYDISSIKVKENKGKGRWIFHYQQMGVSNDEHPMYMRNAVADLNSFLNTVINPGKDKDKS